MYDTIVLGAGVVGINTAYWLANAGLKTLVVDRQPLAGNETSYANGGQISVSFAEPWASPANLRKILGWLFNKNAPLLFRLQPDHKQWLWLLAFLRQCTQAKYEHNVKSLVQLGLYSRNLLKQVRSEHNLKYDSLSNGILQIFRTESGFVTGAKSANLMRLHGCNREVLSKEQALAKEPALLSIADKIYGATYTAEDESGDAHQYCLSMQKVCQSLGVDFWFNTEIEHLYEAHGLVSVQVKKENHSDIITAPHIIVACGSYSAPLLNSIRMPINMYPVKGYSVTIPAQNIHQLPRISITDDHNKIVFTSLGNNLRVAGTAELTGYSNTINEQRCQHILNITKQVFPALGGFEYARFWSGLRPTTPSNIPYIGSTQYPNLWLNTGHGTLGWTLGCGSGKLICDSILQGKPLFYSKARTEFIEQEL